MSRGREKRLSRIEQCAADRTEKPLICNCRESTRYHNSVCLEHLLKRIPRVCPVHGFRDLGFFLWVVFPQGRILQEDRQFCPCVANPWSAFIRGTGPHTLEGLYAVREAFCKETLPGYADFDDDGVVEEIDREMKWEEENADFHRAMGLLNEYDKAFKQWLWKTGQVRFVSKRELARFESRSRRRYRALMREVGKEYMADCDARKSV